MAIEFLSKVLTSYKADVSDHVAGLKKLKGAELERAKETIAANEKIKGSLEDQVKSIGKVSVAVGGIVAAFAGARAAMNSYAEHSRNTAAATGVNMDRLRAATKGLKSDTELLADAARLNNGVFKLTTDQMMVAEQAMLQFTRRGIDNAKAHDAILQAVTALKIDGLKDLGVFVDMTGLKMENEADRGKILERVLQSLTGASNEFARSQLSAAENVQATGVKMENAIDRLKNNVGKGVNDVVLGIESMGKSVARWWGGPKGEDTLAHHIENNVLPYLRQMSMLSNAFKTGDQYVILRTAAQIRSDAGLANDPKIDMALYGAQYKTTRLETPKTETLRAATGSAARAAMTAAQALAQFARSSTEEDGTGIYGGALGAPGGLGSAASSPDDIFGAGITKRLALEAQRRGWAAKALEEQEEKDPKKRFWGGLDLESEKGKEDRAKKSSFMEQTFGPIDQFNTYKAAWEGFTGAVTAGYSAMVDGTMSFGKAFRLSVAQALKATGAQMLIESLKEAAYGTAALFTPGGQAAAAGHFKSSAMFLAGSVAAGVAARGLGGSGAAAAGGAAPGGAGSGAPGPRPANSNSSGGSSIVYVIGDPFDTEVDPRRRQANAERVLQRVAGNRAGGQY